MNVRKEALRLLRTAEQKDAYLSRLLDGALQSSPLSERDRALLAALVFGVTEKRVTLDYCIDALCSTHEPPGARMRMILRLGAYQLLFLDRIPPHAAVAETVALGKSPGERAFLNGLLRTMARKLSFADTLPRDSAQSPAAARIAAVAPLPKDPAALKSVLYALSPEVIRLFEDNLGDRAEDALLALAAPPPTTICVNTLRLDAHTALERLAQAGIPAKKMSGRAAQHSDSANDRICVDRGRARRRKLFSYRTRLLSWPLRRLPRARAKPARTCAPVPAPKAFMRRF